MPFKRARFAVKPAHSRQALPGGAMVNEVHRSAIAVLVVFFSCLLPLTAASQTAGPASVTLAGDLQSELGCQGDWQDRKSTRLNSSHLVISYAVFCLKK